MRSGGSRFEAMKAAAARCILVMLLIALTASPSLAQTSGQASASKPAAATAAAPISSGQAQQLLDVLNDPKKRAAFTSTLTAMARSLPAAPASAPATPAKVTLAPDSLGRELLSEVGTVRSLVIAQSAAFGRMFSDVVLTTRWLNHQLLDPRSRSRQHVDASGAGVDLCLQRWRASQTAP